MSVIKFVLFFVAVLLLGKVVQYFAAVKSLLILRFKRFEGEVKSFEEMPAYLSRLLLHHDDTLGDLGFSMDHLEWFDSSVVSGYSEKWALVYCNEENHCYADVTIEHMPTPMAPVKVEFTNVFADGSRLGTVNGIRQAMVEDIPGMIVNDPFAPTVQEQYASHLQALERDGRTGVQVSPEAYLAGWIGANNAHLALLEEKGYLKEREGVWRWRLWPAMKQSVQVLRDNKKVKALQAAQMKAANMEPAEIPIEAEINAYHHMEGVLERADSGLGWKLMVFVLSLAAGVAIFGTVMSWVVAPLIVAALMVHELGHYLAMLMFGYADRQILFLPFGAATLGRKADASVMEKTLVFLAGPALGLLAGTVCLFAGKYYDREWLMMAGVMFLLLNYLNLLPIAPLDGGRVFEAALFSRAPVLKSVFLALSIVVMGVAALALQDSILVFLAIMLGLGAKGQIQTNRAHSEARRRMKAAGIGREKEAVLVEVLGVLKEKAYAKLPLVKRYELGRSLVGELTVRPAGLAEAVVSVGLYVGVIALPLVTTLAIAIFLGITGREFPM